MLSRCVTPAKYPIAAADAPTVGSTGEPTGRAHLDPAPQPPWPLDGQDKDGSSTEHHVAGASKTIVFFAI